MTVHCVTVHNKPFLTPVFASSHHLTEKKKVPFDYYDPVTFCTVNSDLHVGLKTYPSAVFSTSLLV